MINVPKKSGGRVEGDKLRTCIDGRPVNKLCKGVEYNLPTAEQMFKNCFLFGPGVQSIWTSIPGYFA